MLRNLRRICIEFPAIGSWVYDPRAGSLRPVNTVAFAGGVYSRQEEKARIFGNKIKKYCKDTGLDDLGAYLVVAPGGEHHNDSDEEDRITVKVYNDSTKKMIFSGPDRDWNTLHIYSNEALWPKPGELKLKGLAEPNDRDIKEIKNMSPVVTEEKKE
ncbi:hypothetical protein ACEPAG_2974 [Sanghuangporus baumii]